MTPERRVRLLLLAFWIAPALVGVLGFQLVPSRLNPDVSFSVLLLSQLGMWGTWGLWSVLIWSVAARVPFTTRTWPTALLVHLVLGSSIIVAQFLLQAAMSVAAGFSERHGFVSTVVLGVRSYGDVFVVLYCAIVGAQVAFRWYSNWQTQRVLAARVSEDLAQAQLRALQAQLNPHFLFNALNSVVTLIGRDPALAQRTVVRLADLLRATLRAGDAPEHALSHELDVTRRYLELEQVRFNDRLSVEWDIAADGATTVPAFALQPLVENALMHGIAPQTGAGVVTIGARDTAAALELRVADNGVGPETPSRTPGEGVGLANLRARIARLYGDAASLTLNARPSGGAEAVLTIPRRR